MNTSDPITLAERLAKLPIGVLAVELSKARTRVQFEQTRFGRAKAMIEVEAIKKEIFTRGLAVTE